MFFLDGTLYKKKKVFRQILMNFSTTRLYDSYFIYFFFSLLCRKIKKTELVMEILNLNL